ncbi:hypothetical protein AGLY_014554 [Aphis glycines]|uniref:Uncharacterized protein n=1 Tax=Aphis glycines TaxID=307491 RepID=A0A6G0T3B5_APHGL|nr:hypothetical protein AGLY_014554 [Aphis glycines]
MLYTTILCNCEKTIREVETTVSVVVMSLKFCNRLEFYVNNITNITFIEKINTVFQLQNYFKFQMCDVNTTKLLKYFENNYSLPTLEITKHLATSLELFEGLQQRITDLSYSISLPICIRKLSRSEIVRVNNVHTVYSRNEKIIITFSRKSPYSMTITHEELCIKFSIKPLISRIQS